MMDAKRRAALMGTLFLLLAFFPECAGKKEEGVTPSATGSISGVVKLQGATDHSGILVELLNTNFSTTTKADGSFQISDLPPAPYTVRVSKKGYTIKQVDVEVEAGKTTTIQPLTLEPSITATGTAMVVGFTDQSGIKITLIKGETTYTTTTESDGSYRIEIPPGDYKVVAEKGEIKAEIDVSLTAENPVIPKIELFSPELWIKGKQVKETVYPAAKFSKPPLIDGKLSDWNGFDYIYLGPQDYVDYQGNPDTGDDDMSAYFALGWDPNNLYFAAEVHDDIHINDQSGESIWNGDCIQIGIDPQLQRSSAAGTWYELGIALTSGGVMTAKFGNLVINPPSGSGKSDSSEKAVVRNEKKKVTYYEWKIPASDILPITLQAGKEIGFGLVVNDNDFGKGQEGWLKWGEGNGGICLGKNAGLFYRIRLK
jgi:hypothetical protein